MSLTKPALASLLLLTLGAPHLALEMWVYAQSPQSSPTTAPPQTQRVQDNTGELGFPGAASQPPTNIPTIHVYSRETILDVLVTDDKGQPVRGLTRSDFTVEEDNKPQPIRSFYEIDHQPPPPSPQALPPNTFTNSTALPRSGPVQVILFDLLGTRQADAQRCKQYIADYLRTMPTGTQVAVFEFSPSKGLALLQGFTTDGHAAAAVVNDLDVEWLRNGVAAYPIAIAGMNQIAAYVASVRGRKNLLWIVQGMPMAIVHDGGRSWGVTDPVLIRRFMDLYDTFTREQIAIYPFDPRGVHGFGWGFNAQTNALLDQNVAAETGGDVPNSNDFKTTVANIVDDTLHGYTLSFVPPRPAEDGKYHKVTVSLSRPGLHLSYRPGYNDEQPQPPDAALAHDMTQGPMRLGAIPTTQILFDLHVQPAVANSAQLTPASSSKPPKHARGAPYITAFTFAPTQISLTQQPDGTRTANIELDLGAFDFYGKLVTARSEEFKITVTPEQYTGFYRKPLSLSLAIDLPSGPLTLRAGVFDTAASKAGTLEFPYTIPKK